MYVNRETGLLRGSLSDHDLTPTATTARETRSGSRGRDGGSTDGVKGVASRIWTRSTTSSSRRHNAGTAAARTARRGRDETRSLEAAIRHRRPSDNFSVALSTQRRHSSTTARPSNNSDWHSQLGGSTHGRQYASSSGSETRPSHTVGLTLRQLQRRLLWLLSFATGTISAQLLELSSNYTVSRLLTLTVSQNYYDGPSPRRSLKYIYTQWLSRVNSHLILTRRYLAHAGTGTPARAPYSHKIICHRPRCYTTSRDKETNCESAVVTPNNTRSIRDQRSTAIHEDGRPNDRSISSDG